MTISTDTSPFHVGEQAVQTRLGVRERTEMLGSRMIRDHMTEQHREFFGQLPFALIGASDRDGHPWASVVVGGVGFATSADPYHLDLHATLLDDDPLRNALVVGSAVGVLGIEFSTRRRNRLSARVAARDAHTLRLTVEQSYGNCPQYIQARSETEIDSGHAVPQAAETFTRFDSPHRTLIDNADSFFIASYHGDQSNREESGADVSHRGGAPSFVRVVGENTLVFPDYAGNRHFSTLGNIELNSRAGLTFIDYRNGDVLYLTGAAEILWVPSTEDAERGAERMLRFTLLHGRAIRRALPIAWAFESYAPRLPGI